jgi:hypothetical protein
MQSKKQIISKLKKLTATKFENLVFDLMILSGLKNVIWRTPGADAGRDIEGYWAVNDFSENLKLEHWYIECKRYKNAIDWPTVYKKISYADTHNADYLLLVTTANISPRCKEEITNWEKNHKSPIVRYWDGTTLEKQISKYPILLSKYSLVNEKSMSGVEFLPAINIALKSVHSAYNTATFNDSLSSDLELCASLVDLITARIDESKQLGYKLHRRFILKRDLYIWCIVDSDVTLSDFDSFGLRVLLSAIKFCSRSEKITISPSTDGICEIPFGEKYYTEVFNNIAIQASIHSNIEFFYKNKKLILNLKKEED